MVGSRQQPAKGADEPPVLPVGRPSPLPIAGGPHKQNTGEFGYVQQVTITRAGALKMADGRVDFREWTEKDANGADIITPPKE